MSVLLKTLYTTGNYGLYELESKDKAEIQSCIVKGVRELFTGPWCSEGTCGDPYTWTLYKFEYARDNIYLRFNKR